MIIPAIAGWFTEKVKAFVSIRFELGILVAAMFATAYYPTVAAVKFISLDKKARENPPAHLDALLDKGDKSYDIFLNQLQVVLPDKWRKFHESEAGHP